MDFMDKINQFSKRINLVKDNLETEEATKTALVLPFFQLLGYDIFNPLEFVPEFVADVGIKKGEKVDYAIMGESKPIILIEAKSVTDKLTNHDSQLFRYFTTTEAKFAILTNGVIYKFFTDLEEPNKMDEKPFLEINLLELNETKIQELKKFQKESFDTDTIFNIASELKYTNLIKEKLNNELNDPSDEFVRYIINDFFNGVKTASVVDKFKPIVKKSMQDFVSDFMSDKLKNLLAPKEEIIPIEEKVESTEVIENELTDSNKPESSKILTTQEELEGYYIVKSILSERISTEDINYKDVERYFGILLHGNTRKWICRLYFNSSKKSFTLPDENKKEVRYYIETLDDIYKYKQEITQAAERCASN